MRALLGPRCAVLIAVVLDERCDFRSRNAQNGCCRPCIAAPPICCWLLVSYAASCSFSVQLAQQGVSAFAGTLLVATGRKLQLCERSSVQHSQDTTALATTMRADAALISGADQ